MWIVLTFLAYYASLLDWFRVYFSFALRGERFKGFLRGISITHCIWSSMFIDLLSNRAFCTSSSFSHGVKGLYTSESIHILSLKMDLTAIKIPVFPRFTTVVGFTFLKNTCTLVKQLKLTTVNEKSSRAFYMPLITRPSVISQEKTDRKRFFDYEALRRYLDEASLYYFFYHRFFLVTHVMTPQQHSHILETVMFQPKAYYGAENKSKPRWRKRIMEDLLASS